MISIGWPLIFCGTIKIDYDLTLRGMFGLHGLPAEPRDRQSRQDHI